MRAHLITDAEGRAVRTNRIVNALDPDVRRAVAAAFIPQYATDRVDVELELVRGTGMYRTVRLYLQGVAYNAQTGGWVLVGWQVTGAGADPRSVDQDLTRMVIYPLTLVRSLTAVR